MKIGILTHHYINNYGAFLQTYALQKTLSELFPDDEVQIIDCINWKHFIINTGGWFRFYRGRENIRCWLRKIRTPLVFARARKMELVLSPRCHTAEQINRMNYDCIVIGSDEVWNYADTKGSAQVKFGIGLDCRNLISYAPSMGNANPDEPIPPYVTEGIKKFKALSTRDDLTFELCKKVTGTSAIRVLDPTFLSQFPSGVLRVDKRPYILFYYCEHLPEDVLKQILEYAHSHHILVYGAGECDRRYTDITVDLVPFDWIELFRNAEFVFTGTFHGTVFSILNRKQFKVYLTNQGRIKKVGALLKEFGIEDREIRDDFRFDLESQKAEIDYGPVYEIIAEKKQQSLEYLYQSVKGSLEG